MSETIEHSPACLARYKMVLDQYRLRKDAVVEVLERHKDGRGAGGRRFDVARLDAIASRGGPLLPLPGGVYRITPRVVSDIRRGKVQTLHPSLLGPLVAHELGGALGIPAYFVDPESTDEFRDISRVSGLKGVSRRALSHALSCRAVALAAAKRLGRSYSKCNLVVAHLGTGITVAAHVKGRQVDATNANDEGPFSPQRAGTLPNSSLVRLCFSGRYTEQDVINLIHRRGGLISHFGTDDIRLVERLVKRGNASAVRVYDAMVYQIAKAIGAYSVACKGKVDAVVLTGGLTDSRRLVNDLKKWIRFLSSRVFVYRGEEEMSALAGRLLAVLKGKEKARRYEQEVTVRR